MSNQQYFVHPTAVVEADAEIGAGTKIWHFSHFMQGSKVGSNCIFGQNAFVGSGVEIGNGVKVQNNVSIYPGVVIEDDVFLGPSVVFTNVINPRSIIERKNKFQKTIVRKGATIGANATIICGMEIGAYALIGAGAVVTKNVLPYALVKGNPARQTGWVSQAGFSLKFDEDNNAVCPETGEKYKLENNCLQKLS